MLWHGWLPELVLTRSALGPHGTDLLEHVLVALAGCPADVGRKLGAFAVMSTLTAALALNELNGSSGVRQLQGAYLAHAIAAWRHIRLAAAPTGGPLVPAPSFEDTVGRVLVGLLGNDQP